MSARLAFLALTLTAAAPAAAQDTTAAPQPAAASAVTVAEAVIARSVMDRVPQDTGSAFSADVGELILFTRISGSSGADVIHHVWFHGDEQVADVELRVGGSPWRTWSRKTIPMEWTGAWHVEVRDASGAILKRVDFTVGQ